ncbi:hypothetical protein [Roseitranquillus sediminis]|uniref:hypothetical protein n=1 Tax=Roseitranquillus sediminis TaxID=2809051 RepID=UPI001D0C569B|nr:hypothetical protein [Roseitranquillus sediminis]MBM9593832.1 hypothetical protein [Roseitranquillus sediminis]
MVEPDGSELEANYFKGEGVKPDRLGETEDYRCHPPGDGHNETSNGVYYRSLEDPADHLLANPDWGLRVTTPASPPSLRYSNVSCDGLSQ